MTVTAYLIAVLALSFVLVLGWTWLKMLRSDETNSDLAFSFKSDLHEITKKDRLLVLALTAVYTFVAFTNLGDTDSPESLCVFEDYGSYVNIELEEATEIGSFMFFTGLYTGKYYVQFSTDGETYEDASILEQNYVALFKWNTVEIEEEFQYEVKYIRLIANSHLELAELAIYDTEGNMISSDDLIYNAGAAPIFDEQELVPEEMSYLNSSYFDEIYHARTALEHLEEVKPYEISHPPLGKIIISIGISIFGMNPFGWRFMGTLFGALMLPILYALIKRMFGKTKLAVFGTLVFATDFMHFTQTRIATIDTYAVFFILLMYYFMWLYVSDGKKRNLALSGVFFGLGAASKWTCIYAGAGLGVIWLIHWISQRKQEDFIKNFFKNVAFCLVFFVAVPLMIYYISYYPYGTANGLSGVSMFFSKEYFEIVWNNQVSMFTYHSGLVATHPYSSRWYQWLVDGYPILYYLHYFGDGTKSVIAAFLSPVFCWSGLIAIIMCAFVAIRKRTSKAVFIVIGYLAQVLPWVLVTRLTFEYHYFPATVFLILAICYLFNEMLERKIKNADRWLIAFGAVSVLLFIMYYPVISGARVSTDFTSTFLKWIPSWMV